MEKDTLRGFLHEDLIFLQSPAKKSTDVFEEVNAIALEKGYVNDKFLTKIVERESTFPTGLQLEQYAVAIPHTDADTIEQEFVSVVVPKEGVAFSRMDDPTEKVSANLVFVLGLNQPHKQLEMLQTLMAFIQDTENIEKLLSAKNAKEVIEAC